MACGTGRNDIFLVPCVAAVSILTGAKTMSLDLHGDPAHIVAIAALPELG